MQFLLILFLNKAVHLIDLNRINHLMKTLRFSRNLEETFLTNFCGQVGMAGANLNLALTCPAGNFIKKDNSNTDT